VQSMFYVWNEAVVLLLEIEHRAWSKEDGARGTEHSLRHSSNCFDGYHRVYKQYKRAMLVVGINAMHDRLIVINTMQSPICGDIKREKQ